MSESMSSTIMGIDNTESTSHMTCINQSTPHIEYTPVAVGMQTFYRFLIIMNKPIMLPVIIIDTIPIGRNPDTAIQTGRQRRDIIGSYTMNILGIVQIIAKSIALIIVNI